MGTACSVCRREGSDLVGECSFPQPTNFFQNTTQQRLDFLAQVKLFQRLPEDQHNLLASACEEVVYQDEVIIKQGDHGHEFFVIKDGKAEVLIGQTKQVTLKTGDYFGENALLRDEPRTATIKAVGRLKALKITRDQFVELGLREKLDFPQRKAVGGNVQNIVVKDPTPKTESQRVLISNALKANENLQSVVDLDIPRIKAICDIAWQEAVPKGTKLITEGDLNADYFYIVQSGSFNVIVEGKDSVEAKPAGSSSARIGPGGSFGELALLYFAPRAATVQAADDSSVWIIDRGNFKRIMAKSSDEREAEYLKHLDKVDVLSPLKKEEKAALAKCLTEVSFVKGDVIFKQGDEGDSFYLLVDGTVEVVKDEKATSRLQGAPDKARFFGERALLKNEPRAATIKVVSPSARTLMVDKQSFDMLLGPLEELKKRGKSGPGSKLQDGEAPGVTGIDKSRFGKIKRKDLKVLGLLGCGGFGAVELVEHSKDQSTYALKALSKGFVVKSGMQKSVMSEKNVQLMCDSSFVIKVFETFNSPEHLYFLLELALGGELYATYHRKGLFGKEVHGKFYVAGVVIAFDHLHSKKIVFRDLKPENLLLSELGHIKLTDMGLAKVILGKTFTTCGTPDYFAPELIASSGHTLAVDWWTLGVLTYELMSGNPPFESANPMQTYQKVKRGIDKVLFPPKCKGTIEDLVKKLCRHDPSQRLPMKSGGVSNVKEHSWYKDFDWKAFENLTMETPYRPAVKSKKDIANFSAKDADRPPQVAYKDDKSGWDKDFATSD
ncbi:unnamed protein product [Cladocopium goreaui]|uniref:cGMP-dependent protein kinase 1 (CGK 1) (CGK1) (cGMP-dependent protein kinase I) (cGKI) n=1 Tax=Cladocopium goreaui TaxID=2562237 RepID=A0A9P1D4R2_9DINO|nr:unnamed protein product [Cladocopium goreaui]